MDRTRVNRICAEFPGAEVSDPWGGGHDAWKVGGKIFATIGARDLGLSVKTESVETAELVIAAGRGARAPYLHRSWVLLPWGVVPDSEVEERLRNSYALVRAGLTKTARAALAPFTP